MINFTVTLKATFILVGALLILGAAGKAAQAEEQPAAETKNTSSEFGSYFANQSPPALSGTEGDGNYLDSRLQDIEPAAGDEDPLGILTETSIPKADRSQSPQSE